MKGPGARDRRIAVIGAGPRAFFAVERLVARGRAASTRARVRIDAFDPAPAGAGEEYDVAQPDYLRLTIPAGLVDAWVRTGETPSPEGEVAFGGWLPPAGDGWRYDVFPPRALVGQYLCDAGSRLRDQLPEGWELVHHGRRVSSLVPCEGGRWSVHGTYYDEVLVCSRLGASWSGSLQGHWSDSKPLIGDPSPVGLRLGERQIRAGASVGVRGAGRTFLDVLLALTEGRGGVFEPGGRPHRMVYRRSGRDVAVVYPFSRTGRFPEVVPTPDAVPAHAGLDEARHDALVSIAASGEDADRTERIALETARLYLERARAASGAPISHDEARVAVDDCFAQLHRTALERGLDPRVELERSVRVALGEEPLGPEWALGQAWRDLHLAMSAQFTRAGAGADARRPFWECAVVMQPLTFGPAPINGVKLLALIAGGVVDPRSLVGPSLDAGGVSWPDTLVMPEPRIDVIVDAVGPPPGYREQRQELLDRLVEEGHVRLAEGRAGIEITEDARAVGRDGSPTPGLSCLGRLVEDVEIGDQVLVRQPDDVAERWASRIASGWF